jgi:glycosyltransferase involved in cell wall biosynthesis
MNIALLIDDRYPQAGGTARVVERLAAYLSAEGHHVAVFCPSGSLSSAPDTHIVSTLRLPGLPEGSLNPSEKDRAVMTAFRPDVVHSHTERGAYSWARHVSARLGIAHVHTFHADYSVLHPYYPLAKILTLWLDQRTRRLLKQVKAPASLDGYYTERDRFTRLDWQNLARFAANTDYFTTPSPRIFHFLKEAGVARRGHLLPFGIDPEWFAEKATVTARDGVPTIISVGRLDSEKRVDVIIKGFQLMRERGIQAKLQIVGTGSAEASLRRLAATKFSKDIHFQGQVKSADELRRLYRGADIFALGSYHYETQGLVLLEAAASGLPIVYCDDRLEVGLSKGNSILATPDPQGFADAFATLAADQSARHAVGLASLDEAHHYPSSKFFESIIQIYRQQVRPGV